MKKILKVSLIFILILTLCISVFVWWQWENIRVVYLMLNYSQEEIDAFVSDNENEINRILNELTLNEIRPLNDTEMEKLLNGEITDEEAIELINPESDGKKVGKTSKVDDIIARMYLLRAEYINALSALESEVFSYVKSIPSKSWNVSKKLEVIDTYTGKAVALEGQCDAKMNSLINELEAELKRTGEDTGIISDVKSAYATEKEMKKSQYLSKYGKYLY